MDILEIKNVTYNYSNSNELVLSSINQKFEICQNAISTQMGKHTLQIAADRDQDRANCRQGRINSGSVTKSGRSQKPQGSKAHQSHMWQGSKGTGQRGDANIFPDWASHHQKAVIHLFHRITEFSLHSATSIACWRTTSSL